MKLFKHQKELLELNPDKHLLAWGTGSGKTRIAIELADIKGKKTLVICPKSLTQNWVNEIEKWSTRKNKELEYLIYSKEVFKKAIKINPDGLSAYKTVIIDEFHYFSNYKSQLTKALLEYIEKSDVEYIYGLTATPYLSTPFNIYTLAKILGYNWNWYKFEKAFFNKFKMGNRFIPVVKKNIEKEIARLVNVLGSTVKLEDCFDVPEQTFLTEYFELTPEQKKGIYELDAILPIVRINHIQQISGGYLKKTEYEGERHFKCEKNSRAIEHIAENKKIAIVCRFNAEIDNLYINIKKKFPKRNLYKMTGKQSGKERQETIDKIHNDKDSIILINAAVSEGYSLETIPIMVFYSMDYSLKSYIQIIGRLLRASKLKKNIYIFYLMKDKLAVDYQIYDCVVNKKMDFNDEIYRT